MVHSFLMVGQSNMAGRGLLNEAIETDCSNIKILKNGCWQKIIESIWSIEELLDKIHGYTGAKVIELFSHECCFERISRVEGYTMPQLYEYVIKWAYEQGYGFGFAQDIYEDLGD